MIKKGVELLIPMPYRFTDSPLNPIVPHLPDSYRRPNLTFRLREAGGELLLRRFHQLLTLVDLILGC